MYQFIHRGTLRILAERGREALAEHLHCRPEELETRRDSASKGAFTGAEGTGGQAERLHRGARDQRPCSGGSGGVE